MISIQKAAMRGMAVLAVAATAACSSTGGLGNILGSVLGQGQQQQGQVSGTVRNVDTRSQQLQLQQSNGQNVTLGYDNQTQVVYQNQKYSVSNLEYGDQVTARVSTTSNNQYYTDLIQVDQSVTSTNGTGSSANVQLFEGSARNIDRTNGTFQITGSNYGTLVVSLPYNPRQADVNRFQNLRSGDYVRVYGVLLNNNRVELRQFN
ncbi:MAG TPA: hypothetical protein VM053_02920 [Gemmatimonadaceae bacterium]|nr:hypothetical protein [Gemmatimonadaceae bacterium]